jgi:hypothetical protein
MAKTYESLMGAFARSVFYRPERQRVRELLSRDARPKLLINGHEFPLFDISMNGVSFLTPETVNEWPVGRELRVSLLLHGQEVYSGEAKIARAEAGPRGARIGIGLTTGFLDLPAIRRHDDEVKLEQALADGPESVERLVPHEYREIVSKVLHFFQYHRRSLDYHEQRYRNDGATDAEIMDLTVRAADALREPYRDLQREASIVALTCLMDRDVLLPAKEYTETILVPLTLDVPLNHRAYTKPLGYPGDYQVMLYYYANSFEGNSVYAKVMHKFAVEHPLSHGVRTRKDLMIDLMEEEHQRLIAADGEDSVLRIVGLGCGPAREVSEYIARNRTWPGSIVWTLIDQEEEALSVAYRESRSEIAAWGSQAHLNLLNLSFVQLLSEGVPLQEPESQHFIFSTGLFDYIRESRAQTLIRAMYDLLTEGGLMAIGNAIAPQEFFWTAEFMVDWTILYRTREEMRQLASLLPDTAEVDVVVEPGEAYYFLLIRKH